MQALVVESDDLDAFFVAFWLVAALVLTVALANLGSTILLGIRERFRELGVLRSVGFTPAQLVRATAVATAALVAASILVGVPAGMVLNTLLTRSVGKATGYGPELGTPPTALLVFTTITTLALVAVLLGTAVSVRAARRSASELLRYE